MAILWLAKRHKTITAELDLAMMRAGFAGTEANMKRLDVLAYVLVALIGASAVASGQWVRYPTEGIPRKPDGKPTDPYARWCGRLCQEDAKASCYTKDEGGPFGAAL